VRQIEIALERLRWLPDLRGQRFIELNIPMYRVRAWDPLLPEKPALGMRAIVGRARHTPTPVLHGILDTVIFRPYWNVPRSILLNEILPLLAQDPGYLEREQMEIVSGAGDAAAPVEVTAENIELLKQGTLRLRQRPGAHNALGLVKFEFPNDAHVYLHDTPAKTLFGRARRDFSHGCVRVEQPISLAEWVLKEQPDWSRDQIAAAAADAGRVSRAVRVATPIPVMLPYRTAVVMPGGDIHFAEDIYGHDAAVGRALSTSAR
jgi:murein L,D-transpeptidase YcbB/YkuD